MQREGRENGGFVVPEDLLERLNECSFGGFIFFCFNEHGEPDVYSKMDNNVNSMALQHFIRNWSKALDEASIETSKAQMLRIEDEEDGDNLDDDELI